MFMTEESLKLKHVYQPPKHVMLMTSFLQSNKPPDELKYEHIVITYIPNLCIIKSNFSIWAMQIDKDVHTCKQNKLTVV
jgi:hypothetical protein